MGQVVPEAIAHYLEGLHGPADEVLEAVGREGRAEGLPLLDPASGRLLRTLALASGARRVLEIGTAIGYSALWIAQVLPADGQVISLEIDAARAGRARAHFERAGLADRISVIVGDASRFLHKVSGPFDLVFQDGPKLLYEPLLDRLVRVLRPGGLLVSDNVLRGGRVAVEPGPVTHQPGPGATSVVEPGPVTHQPGPGATGSQPGPGATGSQPGPGATPDAEIRALQSYNRRLAADARLLTTFVAIGDGVSISVKLPER